MQKDTCLEDNMFMCYKDGKALVEKVGNVYKEIVYKMMEKSTFSYTCTTGHTGIFASYFKPNWWMQQIHSSYYVYTYLTIGCFFANYTYGI